MSGSVKLFLIAGEPSGDRLGAALMAGLKSLGAVEFAGIGGPLMQAEGMTSLFPMDELSVMGIAEVLPKYLHLRRRIRETAAAVLASGCDALVTIEIEPHAFFVRDGDDVRLELPVTLDEAVRGAKVKVPTVDGPVMLTVAPGSGSGKVLRLKGKGFSRKGGGRGDQLVALEIQLPDDLGELAGRLEGWSDATPVRNRLGV